MTNNHETKAVWRKEGLKSTDGILVACDQSLEWILPWWWSHYKAHNSYEVVFVDFGLSPIAKDWCKSHGELISLEKAPQFIATKSDIPPERVVIWEKLYSPERLWSSRTFWFRTPLAFLQSPFKRTLWLDVDCEVRGNLKNLFDYCSNDGIGLTPEPDPSVQRQLDVGMLLPDQKYYNTGVVVFTHGSPIIQKWAEGALSRSDESPGNQNLLANIIYKEKMTIHEMPRIYNWRMAMGENPNAVVVHWVSNRGKMHIRQSMNLSN